jgi:hypothetical protein
MNARRTLAGSLSVMVKLASSFKLRATSFELRVMTRSSEAVRAKKL